MSLPTGEVLGRLRVGMHGLRIETFRECNHLVGLNRNGAEPMHVAFDIVFEVAVGNWVRKRHDNRRVNCAVA